jgi:ketosteroid isomerase-like protein
MVDVALTGPAALVQRLEHATNSHDVEAVAACFSVGYRNETPAHPSRSFAGVDQVRANWEQIFAHVPDITAEVLSCCVDGEVAWTEWEHRGTRLDGSAHHMRGVIVFGVADGQASWARFYLEPVDDEDADVNEAVRRQVSRRESK